MKCIPETFLGTGVESGRAVVEDENLWLASEGARNRNALFLST